MIGYLTPEAEFIECEHYGHLDLALEITETKYEKQFMNRIDAENFLLNIGVLVLRARDAYMNYWNEDKISILLTDEQIKWIADNIEGLNPMQKKDLSEILEDQDDLRKRNMRNLK